MMPTTWSWYEDTGFSEIMYVKCLTYNVMDGCVLKKQTKGSVIVIGSERTLHVP